MNRERVVKLRDELKELERLNSNVVQDSGLYAGAAQAYDLCVRKVDALLAICDHCDSRGVTRARTIAGGFIEIPCLLCSGSGKQPAESETDER